MENIVLEEMPDYHEDEVGHSDVISVKFKFAKTGQKIVCKKEHSPVKESGLSTMRGMSGTARLDPA